MHQAIAPKLAAKLRQLSSLAVISVTLAACGGGGGGDDSPAPNPNPTPTNSAPTANAGADQTVDGGATVTLAGSGTDPNSGDTLTYTWSQTGGPDVTLTGADQATASFTAPTAISDQLLTFRLAVSDGSLTSFDSVDVTVRGTGTGGGGTGSCSGDVCGKVQFEFVPPNANCRGLDFGGSELRPVRQATVQLLNSSNSAVIATTLTDDNGDYDFGALTVGQNVQVRVLAELQRTGLPAWDVEIRDNVVSGQASPPVLSARPKYALDSAAFTIEPANQVQDLVAASGWDGVSYSGTRAAAPFAVMDSIYNGMRLVLDSDPTAVFAPLDAFWSVNNALVSSGTDIDEGQLPASFYRGDIDSLFLVGDAINGEDTEEFDTHVIVHEWGHYFEDNFSRSDSTGGPHAIGARIDARLAWGEGWATALAAMALDNQLYCDTNFGGNNTGGFGIGAEDGGYDSRGWYDEISVVRFLYDLYDDTNEGPIAVKDPDGIGDPVTLGFAPIYNTMVGPQQVTEAFTTVFSFATELRSSLNATQAAQMDDQLQKFDMNPTGLDIWGSNEDSNREDVENDRDVLPIYTDLPTDGTPVTVCVNDDYDSGRDGNKLAERRFLRINVTQTAQYDVSITLNSTEPALAADDPANDRDQSDPDMVIYRNGNFVGFGQSGEANEEIFTTQQTLQPGIHVADLLEFRFRDDETPANFPNRVCWDVTMAPQ